MTITEAQLNGLCEVNKGNVRDRARWSIHTTGRARSDVLKRLITMGYVERIVLDYEYTDNPYATRDIAVYVLTERGKQIMNSKQPL